MAVLANSVEEVAAAGEEPLGKEGIEIDVACEPMAFYEVSYRLRTQEARNAALVQFLDENGKTIDESHVSASHSPKVGRYAYLPADRQTGLGSVRFFAPRTSKRVRLRFRAWSNQKPLFLAQAIFVRRVAGWTIAAEPGNEEPVRLVATPRPLSVPVPAGARMELRLGVTSPEHATQIVLHAPCGMALEGRTLRLAGAGGKAGGKARPFSEPASGPALTIENGSGKPVVLSLACADAPFIELAAPVVVKGGKALPASANLRAGKRRGSGWIRSAGRKLLDRLLLRSTVRNTQKELKLVAAKVSQIDGSALLTEKKLDYLLAKIDAYADVDDRNQAALQNQLSELENAVKARLAAIEARNVDLVRVLVAMRQAVEKLDQAPGAGPAELKGGPKAAKERLDRRA